MNDEQCAIVNLMTGDEQISAGLTDLSDHRKSVNFIHASMSGSYFINILQAAFSYKKYFLHSKSRLM
jgi:hypothetical protein